MTSPYAEAEHIERISRVRASMRQRDISAMILFAQEHYRDALKQANEAIQQARDAGNREALAEALVAADLTQQFLKPGGSEQMLEALAIYQELGDLSSESMARGNLGVAAYINGRWDEALDWYQGDRETSLRAGNAVGAATAASNIGEILVKRGHFEEAEPILKEAVRVMVSSRFKDGAAWAEVQLARILIGRGELDDAHDLMARVGAEFTDLGQVTSALESALVRSQAMVGLGRAEEALELLDRSASAAGKDAQLYGPQVADERARALTALGRAAEAKREIEKGLTASRDLGLPYEEGVLLLSRVELARLDNREPDPSDLADSKRILDGLGIRDRGRRNPSVSASFDDPGRRLG